MPGRPGLLLTVDSITGVRHRTPSGGQLLPADPEFSRGRSGASEGSGLRPGRRPRPTGPGPEGLCLPVHPRQADRPRVGRGVDRSPQDAAAESGSGRLPGHPRGRRGEPEGDRRPVAVGRPHPVGTREACGRPGRTPRGRYRPPDRPGGVRRPRVPRAQRPQRAQRPVRGGAVRGPMAPDRKERPSSQANPDQPPPPPGPRGHRGEGAPAGHHHPGQPTPTASARSCRAARRPAPAGRRPATPRSGGRGPRSGT